MESPRNPNLGEGGEGEGREGERGEHGILWPDDRFPSISQQNPQIQYMTPAAQMQSMREPVPSVQAMADLYGSSNGQNSPVINQTAAGSTSQIRQQQSAQRQQADRSPAISSTENATPDPLARERDTHREADRRYRLKVKKEKEEMKAEIERLKNEKRLRDQEVDKWKELYEKQREKSKRIEAENELLKKEKSFWKEMCEELKRMADMRL